MCIGESINLYRFLHYFFFCLYKTLVAYLTSQPINSLRRVVKFAFCPAVRVTPPFSREREKAS